MIQPDVLADGVEKEKDILSEVENVSTLTIDNVVERGLKRQSLLLLLGYQMEIIENQQNQIIRDRDNTSWDLVDAKDDLDEMRDRRNDLNEGINGLKAQIEAIEAEMASVQEELAALDPNSPNYSIDLLEGQLALLQQELARLQLTMTESELEQAKGGLDQGIAVFEAQIEALEDALYQLQLAIQQLSSGKIQLTFEVEESTLMLETMLKSNFVQLLSTEKQNDFTQQALDQKEKEMKKMKRQVELGLVSAYELEQAERDFASQKRDLEQANKDFQRELAKLALDIGVQYHEDLELEPVSVTSLRPLKSNNNIDQLVNNSYAMRKAEQDLAMAKLEVDHVKNKRDVSSYEINQAELAVKVEEENMRQLKRDLKENIDDLYYDAAKAYEAVEKGKRELRYAESDYSKLKRQYEIGLISAFVYNQGEIQVKQAAFELQMAELSYYLLLEQVEAMQNGLIQP